jgi:hypothetical protein
MKWILKKGDKVEFDGYDQEVIVNIRKSMFTRDEGGDVLILDNSNSDWVFTALYRFKPVELKNIGTDVKQISVTLILVEKFKEEKLLEDYVYSLRRIDNFTAPIENFRGEWTRLSDIEFDAIVEDKIYSKRTVLGTVLNKMHADHQKSFISLVATEAPEMLTGITDIDKALALLLQYLEFAVIKPAYYLKESTKILENIVYEKELQEIGFAVDTENLTQENIQKIKLQAEVINKHLNILLNLREELELPESETDLKFRNLFRNKPLPFTLKQDK